MRLTGHLDPREEAQELMWEAMELIHVDEAKAASLCHKALETYSDCADALTMLAQIDTETVRDYVERMRQAVAAGRRDLGPEFFEENKGHFWGLIETRPFMRALAMLSEGLIEWETPEAIDEAISVQEEMLELNPGDNQGVRDWLASCYLARKRYDDAAALFARYPDDWLAAPAWAQVLHAYLAHGEERAREMLAEARERNPHVEQYLTGRKGLPRTRSGTYSPGDESEAVYCAEILAVAWKKHPRAKKWLKELTESGQRTDAPDYRDARKGRAASRGKSHAETDPNSDRDLHEIMRRVPSASTERASEIIRLLDAFCDRHLNDEYKESCRLLACELFVMSVPVHRGKPEGWAAGVLYTLGRVYLLSDPAQEPHLRSDDLASGIGVSVSTMRAKARVIEEALLTRH